MAKIGFSTKTFKYTKNQLKQEIINAAVESKEFKKEISRVFQVANRRIQNIEKRGEISPAVEALGDRGKQFSKFKTGGLSWNDLKHEYAKAVAFLRQPTSTATGVREYGRHIQQAYNLTPEQYKLMSQRITEKITSIDSNEFYERYLFRYKDFTGELETSAADAAEQMENEAQRLQDMLEQDIEAATNTLSKVQDTLVDGIEAIFKKFNM